MIDFVDARRKMVDSQIRPNNVTNVDLLAALSGVPRERFVPAAQVVSAYSDRDIPVTDSSRPAVRWLLKPMVLARLIQTGQIRATDRVLDVACATGYSSAVLARIAKDVVAIDQDPALTRTADETLRQLGVANVKVVCGRLEDGWKALAPYDVIVVNGAMEFEPQALFQQLAEGGRLVAIVGTDLAGQVMLYRMERGEVSARPIFNAAAPLLPGLGKPPAFVF